VIEKAVKQMEQENPGFATIQFIHSGSTEQNIIDTPEGLPLPKDRGDTMPFPDLRRVVIVRPSHDSTNQTRIAVNLLEATNNIDSSKDVPLEFGDMVEIPQYDHPLGAAPVKLSDNQISAMINHLHGTAHLIVRDQKVEVPLDPYGEASLIGAVLNQPAVRELLLTSSDLSHVKVSRHDSKIFKASQWILDCSGKPPDLVIRDGDVIEVPEKRGF
jgi:hypothetical protein